MVPHRSSKFVTHADICLFSTSVVNVSGSPKVGSLMYPEELDSVDYLKRLIVDGEGIYWKCVLQILWFLDI